MLRACGFPLPALPRKRGRERTHPAFLTLTPPAGGLHYACSEGSSGRELRVRANRENPSNLIRVMPAKGRDRFPPNSLIPISAYAAGRKACSALVLRSRAQHGVSKDAGGHNGSPIHGS